MFNMTTRKFWFYALGSLIILAAASWVLYTYWYLPNNSGEGDLTLIKPPFSLSEESRAKIPEGFPYPYLTGTNIQVTEGGIDNGSYWVTTQVSDDVPTVIGKYRDFFQKTNWTVDTDIVAQKTAQVSVHRSDEQLTIMATNLSTIGSIVRLVYTGPAWISVTGTPIP